MFREESVLSVLSWNVGELFEFCNGLHCDAKYLLKIAAFWEKFKTISPSTSSGGMAGTFCYKEGDLIFSNKF